MSLNHLCSVRRRNLLCFTGPDTSPSILTLDVFNSFPDFISSPSFPSCSVLGVVGELMRSVEALGVLLEPPLRIPPDNSSVMKGRPLVPRDPEEGVSVCGCD